MGASFAGEPSQTTFLPQPPGTIVANRLVYLSGEGMQSQWRAVTSKKLLGTDAGMSFYQWYLSVYAIDGATYRLRYQSPANGGPFDKVAQAVGAHMWFPVQSAKIVGPAELMVPGVQQLVVQSQQAGADCGSADITIFTYDHASRTVVPAASLENGCRLDAAIVTGNSGAWLRLTGPYYSPTAAMCCPTKPKATATLRYHHGKWIETPSYFKLYPGSFPRT